MIQYKILDFGAGECTNVKKLLAAGHKDISVFDISPNIYKYAGLPIAIYYSKDPILFLDNHSIKYDRIYLQQVLYYFPKDFIRQYLQALKRLLSPNGKIYVEVFNGAALTAPYILYKDQEILTAYTDTSLKKLLEDNGFLVEDIHAEKIHVHGIKSLLYFTFRKLWFLVLRSIYILERGACKDNPKLYSKNITMVVTHG